MTDKEKRFRPHLPHTKKEAALVAGSFLGFFAVTAAARGLLHHEDSYLMIQPETDPELAELQERAAILLPKSGKTDQKLMLRNNLAALLSVRRHISIKEVRSLLAPTRTNEKLREVSTALIALGRSKYIEYGRNPDTGRQHDLIADEQLFAYIESHPEYQDFHVARSAWQDYFAESEAAAAADLAPSEADT